MKFSQLKMSKIVFEDFFLALASGDLNSLKMVLHDEGVFFSGLNKKDTLDYLSNLIAEEGRPLNEYDFIYKNVGICFDFLFVLPAIEIRFVPDDPFSDVNPLYSHRSFGEEACIVAEEKLLRFAARFRDNRIVSLIHPKMIKNESNEWICYN